MRSANLSTLLASWSFVNGTTQSFPFVPVIDGSDGVIPELPSQVIAEGRISRLPVIAGTDLDDGIYPIFDIKFDRFIS